jgi:hypothetical protein
MSGIISSPAKLSKKKSMAPADDRHVLYAAAVQCPEADVEFFKRVYQEEFGQPLTFLREDFCGTAELCAEWVKDDPSHIAMGIDFDQPTLDYGVEHILSRLTPEQRDRIDLHCDDVCNISGSQAELICAQNFSYWVFKTRQHLRAYFEVVRASIKDQGLFVLDLMGGTDSTEVTEQKRRITDGTRADGSKIPTYTYIWDQAAYNPVTADFRCAIHFQLKGGVKMFKAFEYHWRAWTLPEIQELLVEAGFSSVDVYTEGWNNDTDESDGHFQKRSDFDHEGSWIAYLVAKP